MTSNRSVGNSFRLYDPEIAESITKEGRRIMADMTMSIDEILSGGCKPGKMLVLYAKGSSGKSLVKEFLEAESQKQLSNENGDGQ